MRLTRLNGLYPPFGGNPQSQPPPPPRRFPTRIDGRPTPPPRQVDSAWTRAAGR